MRINNFSFFMLFVAFLFLESCQLKKTYLKNETSASIVESPWGAEFNALPPHIDKYPHELNTISPSRIDSLITYAANLGIKWVRLSVNWSNIVDTAGYYHWENTDRIVNGLVEKRIKIALCLNGGHKRYTGSNAPYSAESLEHWKNFAKTFVQRYKGKISNWELWNEPNTVWFWKPAPNASQYVRLMAEFYKLVKESDPWARITGGSMARLDLVFADSILKLGMGQYVDAISFHPYDEFPEAIVKPVKVPVKTPGWYAEADHRVQQLRAMVDSVNPAIRLWQGECGYPSQDNGSGWMGNGPWSPVIQAKWLLRRMLTDLLYNAEMTSYFSLVEYYTGGNIDEGKGTLNSKGLLELQNLTPKPAYKAYQNLASLLNGKLTASFSQNYTPEIKAYGSFYNIAPRNINFLEIKDDQGRKFLAYWVVWRMQDQVMEARMDLPCDPAMSHPMLVNMLTGEITKIKFQTTGNRLQLFNLPLADYPYVVAEYSQIKTKVKN